jgi:hypothetical protein
VVFTDFFNEKTVKTYKCNRLLDKRSNREEVFKLRRNRKVHERRIIESGVPVFLPLGALEPKVHGAPLW